MFQRTYLMMLGFCCWMIGLAWSASINETPQGWASQGKGTTGGLGGTVVEVSSLSDLQNYAQSDEKYILYVRGVLGNGTVEASNRVVVGSNTTIWGLPGSKLKAWVTITKESNVIIRNLTIQGPGAHDVNGQDALNVSGSTNVWVDHCDISDGQDGNFDVINQANYVTISWTRFSYSSLSSDHQFSNLIGNSDSKDADDGKLKTTLHHNWWDNGVKERMPRVRFGEIHVINNLFTSNTSSYCVRAGYKANLLIEGNAFLKVKKPVDLYKGDYTSVVIRNNYFSQSSSITSHGTSEAFTPPYHMTVEDPATIQASIQAGAGATLGDPRQGGSSSSSSFKRSSSSWAVSSSSSSIPVLSTLEAENYCHVDQAEIQTEHAGYQGVGYLNMENAKDIRASWAWELASDTHVLISFRYANGSSSNRPMAIWIDDQEVVSSLSFPSTSTWDQWQEIAILCPLKAGVHTMEWVSLESDGAPNLDRIGFSVRGVTAANCIDDPTAIQPTLPLSSTQLKQRRLWDLLGRLNH